MMVCFVAALSDDCGDIIAASSATLMRVGEDLPEQYMDLVVAFKANLASDAQGDYPMSADADMYRATDAFEDAVDAVEELEDAAMTEQTERRLERAIRGLNRALANLYTAYNGIEDATGASAVSTELGDVIASLSDALDARNGLYGCFVTEEEVGGSGGGASGSGGGNEGQDP